MLQQLNQSLLDKVILLAREAGEQLKPFYAREVEVKIKADATPVTEADLFISQFLIDRLQQLTPNIPILSEENCNIPFEERKHWQEYWIIDPIDGTQQFVNRTDQFSIVIGLVQHNQPVLGIIFAPILDKLYYAMSANGAFLQENGEIRPLTKIKNELDKEKLVITTGSQIQADKAKKALISGEADFFKYGSSSLKAGLVAEGKADCYLRFGDTGEWDTAVAEVILTEVGGAIFDFNFLPLTYNQRETLINPYFVMVNNKKIEWNKKFLFK